MTPVKAIRQHCIDCSGESRAEVRNCAVTDCPLYPFRMGRNPNCRPRMGKTTSPPCLIDKQGASSGFSVQNRVSTGGRAGDTQIQP